MRNRFARKSRDFFILKDVLLPVAIVLAAILIMNKGLDALGMRTEYEQLEAARNAINRAAVQCYALEGQYPPNVQYLVDNYGLRVDGEKYVIHYQAFASNIMPDIDVIPKDLSKLAIGHED
ncbi:MAG: hypothetical protein LBV27_05020 [Oscillospiraceae bacterium]|jgi:hypothetical protein|nr:hypothetical protein [Oscillospiraceae bacterium]